MRISEESLQKRFQFEQFDQIEKENVAQIMCLFQSFLIPPIKEFDDKYFGIQRVISIHQIHFVQVLFNQILNSQIKFIFIQVLFNKF